MKNQTLSLAANRFLLTSVMLLISNVSFAGNFQSYFANFAFKFNANYNPFIIIPKDPQGRTIEITDNKLRRISFVSLQTKLNNDPPKNPEDIISINNSDGDYLMSFEGLPIDQIKIAELSDLVLKYSGGYLDFTNTYEPRGFIPLGREIFDVHEGRSKLQRAMLEKAKKDSNHDDIYLEKLTTVVGDISKYIYDYIHQKYYSHDSGKPVIRVWLIPKGFKKELDWHTDHQEFHHIVTFGGGGENGKISTMYRFNPPSSVLNTPYGILTRSVQKKPLAVEHTSPINKKHSRLLIFITD